MTIKAEKAYDGERWSAARVAAAIDSFFRMYDGLELVLSGTVAYQDGLELTLEDAATFREESAHNDWAQISVLVDAYDDSAEPVYDSATNEYSSPLIASLYLGVMAQPDVVFSRVAVEGEDRTAVRALLALVD